MATTPGPDGNLLPEAVAGIRRKLSFQPLCDHPVGF